MKQTKMTITVGLVLLATVLAGCAGAEAATLSETQPDSFASANLDTSYENALSVQGQLILGTLLLDETDSSITVEQATALLPLWQGLRSTQDSSTVAQAEVEALLKQIQTNMTSDQLAVVRDMQLTQTDTVEWALSNGVAFGRDPFGAGSDGSHAGGPGGNQSPETRATFQAQDDHGGWSGQRDGLSPELQATIQAGGFSSEEHDATFQDGGGFSGGDHSSNRDAGAGRALIDVVIELLTARANL